MSDSIIEVSSLRNAHIAGYFGERYGGVPQVVIALCREMARQGLDVSLWATGTAEDRNAAQEHGIRANLYERRWPRCWFRSQTLMRDLAEVIHEIDVLHLHGIWTYVQQATARLARRSDVPYMITPHGVLEPWRVHHKGFRKHLYLSLLGKRMLNSSACLHAITAAEVEGFRCVGYKGLVTVIPNGVDVPEYDVASLRAEAETCWPILKDRRVVFFLSRLSPEKGLNLLLPAFAELAKQDAYGDVLLVLAGSGHHRHTNAAKAVIEKHGIQRHVVMTGFVQGHEKALLMSRADLYTLPSYSEGFSISVLENLAVGTPVLITTGCNFPEVARVGAGLCCPPTRESVAQALRRLLDVSAQERREMGLRGKELIQRDYTWDVIAARFLRVYRCILKGTPIPLHPEPVRSKAR